MFYKTLKFNQPLDNWNTSNVEDMTKMFYRAKAFKNHDLSGWDVGKVPSDKHYDFTSESGGGNTEPAWK
jgi:surface protein